MVTDVWWKRRKTPVQPWPKPEPCPPPPEFGTRWRGIGSDKGLVYCEDGRLREGWDKTRTQHDDYSQYDWEFGWRALGPLRKLQ
jgi:hypothetical protein